MSLFLGKLPKGMGKLINSRHLMLCNGWRIKSFPKGFGRLTCLRTLTYFPIDNGEGDEICKLGELENLNCIQGSLIIRGLEKVVDLGPVKNALKNKILLYNLSLYFKHLEE